MEMKLELLLLVQHPSLFITHFHFNRDEDVIVGDMRSAVCHLKPTTVAVASSTRFNNSLYDGAPNLSLLLSSPVP
jgi:hypothetical protein